MKKLIESMDHIEECGMNEDPMPTAMPGADAGQPVSMNVSINASGKDHVADLINMMKNAGMSAAEPVGAPSLGMRGDIEKFRSAMDDDPEIPGDDDNPDDTDLKAGIIGALGGAAAGAAIPGAGAALGGVGGMAGGALGGAVGGPAGAAVGSKIGSAIGKAAPSAIGSKIGDKLTGEELATEDVRYDPKQSMPSIMKYAYQPDVSNALAKAAGVDSEEVYFDDSDLVYGDKTVVPRCGVDDNCTFGDAVKALKKFVTKEDYANEPDPEYGDLSDAIPNGNDLNRKKKAYAATQDGDNPMAVENIKAQLMAALSEKKKPDANKNGIPDYAEDGKGPNDLAKGKKGSKPKKGKVPPQFKKKGTDEAVATKDCPKCGAPGKKELMACSTCGCS
jgi:hypothetical protein